MHTIEPISPDPAPLRPPVGSGHRFDPPWRTSEVTPEPPESDQFDQGTITTASTPPKSFVDTTYHVRLEPGQTLEVSSSVLGRNGQSNPRHGLVVTCPQLTVSSNPRTRGQFAMIRNDADHPCTCSFRILLIDWRDATDAVYGITWEVAA